MKVSKIILASLLSAIAINSVMADEYDGPRNRCKSKSDKVWVENTKTCVPKNPCKDSDYKDYCHREFARVETTNLTAARYLAQGYLEIKGFSKVDCFSNKTGEETSLFGQNYIACTTNAGNYFVFEFDDTTNDEPTSKETFEEKGEAASILCEIVGGKLADGYDFKCMGIEKDSCYAWNVALFRAYTSPNVEAYTVIADTYYDSQTKACNQASW